MSLAVRRHLLIQIKDGRIPLSVSRFVLVKLLFLLFSALPLLL